MEEACVVCFFPAVIVLLVSAPFVGKGLLDGRDSLDSEVACEAEPATFVEGQAPGTIPHDD